jgi:hypothetical protein
MGGEQGEGLLRHVLKFPKRVYKTERREGTILLKVMERRTYKRT